uniref:Putative secreted protein n=1 Tax=Ixodes ricinus TaxID=34613 RepID=A0A0K8RLI0_IXORI
MRVVITALLLASFIFCTSSANKKLMKKPSDTPIVTVGYLLYEPMGKPVTWESQFISSVKNVHKHARWWLLTQTISLKLQNRSITQVDSEMSSKLDKLDRESNGTLVDPFAALKIVRRERETNI